MNRRVVLTVSGVVPDDLRAQIANGKRPRADYLELAETMNAELLDVAAARRRVGRFGRLIENVLGPPVLLAWVLFRERRRYDLVFTDGEQVGLPYAILCRFTRRRPLHFMIVHILSVRKKVVLHRVFRLERRIDRAFVYATAQARFMIDELGYADSQVELTPFMVDTEFFAPVAAPAPLSVPPIVSSAGRELRNYPTLIAAATDLDARVILAAASPWSKRGDTTSTIPIPANVEVCQLPIHELRDLYARSSVVVVPLEDVAFQAGITTILEAMAMGKPVICTRTRGQTDTIVDGENGAYVPPGDSDALRRAIVHLLDDPSTAARLGQAARQWAVEHADIDVYTQRLATAVNRALEH